MLLSDGKIKELIRSGVLLDAAEDRVGPITYDLTTDGFYASDTKKSSVRLFPGDSVYVAAKEKVRLPNNLAARVLLKNSRMRQGLSLDAPLYFPGHGTVLFFRVTNVSADVITLVAGVDGSDIAQVAFERIEGNVECPYEGAFADEFNYRGMASYSDVYKAEMEQLEKTANEVKNVENRMYSTVLALMAVFAAIFTLVNINVQAMGNDFGVTFVLAANCAIVGSFAFLCGLIVFVMRRDTQNRWSYLVPWLMALIAFIAAAIIAFLA